MINWLRKNKKYLSINAIGKQMQKEFGMHPDVLKKDLRGSQKIADKWVEPVNEFVKRLREDEIK